MLTMSSGTDATLSDLTGSSKLLVPGKVISSTRIPQGAVSQPINPELLKGVTDIVQISVGASNFTTMDLDEKSKQIWNSEIHWTRALRLADDCHSYNIQLRKDTHYVISKSGKKIQALVLQAARPVEPGQELLLWFSEELLATLHMGFLTPANIQGQKNYVCTQCSALYESPNPLKLHLTLGCGKQTMTWLWEQLSNTMLEPTRSSNEFQFQLQLISEPCIPKQKIAIDLSTPTLPTFKQEDPLVRHFNASAFKPFKKTAASGSIVGLQQNNNVYNSLAHWPRYTSYMPDYLPTPYQLPPPVPRSCNNDDAQIETLVSSLGKYKEGHICLYCGKSYSRKYGLKIHIRTHTGYKPLKCKYCLRPFGDPSNLNKHVRLHAEGETPYKCEICGKVLVRRRDLERHMRSRHPEEVARNAAFFHEDFISDDDQNDLTNDMDEESLENIDIEDSSSNTQDNDDGN